MTTRGYTAIKDPHQPTRSSRRPDPRDLDDGRRGPLLHGRLVRSMPRAALAKVALGLLDGHARHCLIGHGGGPTDPEAQDDELMAAHHAVHDPHVPRRVRRRLPGPTA